MLNVYVTGCSTLQGVTDSDPSCPRWADVLRESLFIVISRATFRNRSAADMVVKIRRFFVFQTTSQAISASTPSGKKSSSGM